MINDLRYAVRVLAKSPGFTAVAVLTLALGVGSTTALFSLYYGVLLKPFPFPRQRQLVYVQESSAQAPEISVSYPNFVDWRARQLSFASLGVSRAEEFNCVRPEGSERIQGAMASHDLFSAIGMAPLLGRLFVATDDRPGADRTVVLRERLWQRLFGGRDSVIGESVNLSGDLYTVIGVLPEQFQLEDPNAELWVPVGLFADRFGQRWNHAGFSAIGRLRASVTPEAARIDLTNVAAQLSREHSENVGHSITLMPLAEHLVGGARGALATLLAAAGFVLLIGCANVANLQLARARGRAHELSVRLALGARRTQIVRGLLAESLVIGLVGCGAGILVGAWLLAALKAALPAGSPRVDAASLNGWALLFALLASLMAATLAGLLPAARASKSSIRNLAGHPGQIAGSLHDKRWRAALIVGELALTAVLLTGGGLMLRTLAKLHRWNPGHATAGVVAFNWKPDGPAAASDDERRQLIDLARERLSRLPGVERAGLTTSMPLSPNSSVSVYYVEGAPLAAPGQAPLTEFCQVDGDYFATMGIRLMGGRTFAAQNAAQSPLVAIVDTSFAARNFPGQSPLGKRFTLGDAPPPNQQGWFEIVGVVSAVENHGPGRPTREQVYLSYGARPPSFTTFVLRTPADVGAVATAVRRTLHEIAPGNPAFQMRTVADMRRNTMLPQRIALTLLAAFAAAALLLAGVGLYGLLTYMVAQRTPDLGVRIALGATPRAIVWGVLRDGLMLVGIGLGVGLPLALALSGVLRGLLYGVSPIDPLTLMGVSVMLSAVALLACWLPARRAARIDPMVALRCE